MTDAELCDRFRAMLDRMVECRQYPNEFREEAHDEAVAEIATFPREPRLLAALDRAVGRSKRRRAEAVYLLAALTDIPGAVERVGKLLREGDAEARSWLIQVIGHRGLTSLAPVLNDIMLRDPNEHCREFAIRAAGDLRADVNLPTLLALADDPGPLSEYSRIPGNILWALKDYARPECRPHLQRAFDRPTDLEDPTIAAWGLCKLGTHLTALGYLAGLTGDWQGGYYTGLALRAAQALADIHGWPFEWGQEGVKDVRARIGFQDERRATGG
jgi:hypothetical protein